MTSIRPFGGSFGSLEGLFLGDFEGPLRLLRYLSFFGAFFAWFVEFYFAHAACDDLPRVRMWLLVVAVLRHDEDSFELTSVAQLRHAWVVAHMPTRDTMVSSRFQGRNAWVFTSGALGMRRLDWVLSRVLQRSPRLCFDFVLAFSLRVSRVPRRSFLATVESRFVHMTLDSTPWHPVDLSLEHARVQKCASHVFRIEADPVNFRPRFLQDSS